MTNLERFIKATNDYYNGRETGMTDQEYDQLEQIVKEELNNPNFDKFDYVQIEGPDRTNVRHYYPYTPQKFKEQFFSDEELRKIILDSSSRGKVATYKMDGCSVTGYYHNGVLFDIVTRANEIIGKRKFDQLKKKFPQSVDPQVIKIDCEAVTSQEDFFEDTRSNSNGLINSCYKQDEVDKYIQLIPFKVTTKDKCKYCEAFYLANYTDEDIPYVDPNIRFDVRYIEYKGKHYPIDGIVLYDKDDNTTQHEIFKHYANENPTTTIRNIYWNFTDKLSWTPKLQFDPIKIDGRMVRQCTSNGYQRLSSIKAGIGAVVTIYLANSTIPQVGKVIKTSENYALIKECPYCGSPMELVNSKLRCSNKRCPVIYNVLARGYLFNMIGPDKEIWNLFSKTKINNKEDLIKVKDQLAQVNYKLKPNFWDYVSASAVLERFNRRTDFANHMKNSYLTNPESWTIFDFHNTGLTDNQSLVFESYKFIYDEIISILKGEVENEI